MSDRAKKLAARRKEYAYKWVAYMFSREPEEFAFLLKYGTPSDRLIWLANGKQAYVRIDNKKKRIHFPDSLNKSTGQKLIYKIASSLEAHLRNLTTKSYVLLQDIKKNVLVRRKDAQANIHIVAEAVLYRVATERKPEVLFAFDSINTWIKAVYGKELGYQTIRKALELLEVEGYFDVIEWGKRGNRGTATKIKVIFPFMKELPQASIADDWFILNYHAMNAVYARESTTRQDVLEARIHCYAEGWLEDQEKEMSLWDQGFRLFKTQDAIISSDAEKVSVENDLEELINDVDINRFLGRLVPALQENGTSDRKGTRQLSESIRSG